MVITLYKTPSPGTSLKAGEYWEIALTPTSDGRFVLREFHENWDETAENHRRDSPPVPAEEPRYFDSIEEGETAWEAQKRVRARQGFMHGWVTSLTRRMKCGRTRFTSWSRAAMSEAVTDAPRFSNVGLQVELLKPHHNLHHGQGDDSHG